MPPSNIQTPASPLGNFPELAQMYQSKFQLPLSNAQVGAQSANDQVTLSNQAAEQDAATKQAAALADPSNYRAVARDDGGFGFYDPTGKEITAAQYAAVTGKTPQDVLKNSTNPIDIGYQKDFKDLESYINLKLQSPTDKAAADKATAIEKDVSKTYGVDISKLTPDQLINVFKSAYPTIYGANQGNAPGVPVGHTLIPQATNNFVQQYFPAGAGTGSGSGFNL